MAQAALAQPGGVLAGWWGQQRGARDFSSVVGACAPQTEPAQRPQDPQRGPAGTCTYRLTHPAQPPRPIPAPPLHAPPSNTTPTHTPSLHTQVLPPYTHLSNTAPVHTSSLHTHAAPIDTLPSNAAPIHAATHPSSPTAPTALVPSVHPKPLYLKVCALFTAPCSPNCSHILLHTDPGAPLPQPSLLRTCCAGPSAAGGTG